MDPESMIAILMIAVAGAVALALKLPNGRNRTKPDNSSPPRRKESAGVRPIEDNRQTRFLAPQPMVPQPQSPVPVPGIPGQQMFQFQRPKLPLSDQLRVKGNVSAVREQDNSELRQDIEAIFRYAERAKGSFYPVKLSKLKLTIVPYEKRIQRDQSGRVVGVMGGGGAAEGTGDGAVGLMEISDMFERHEEASAKQAIECLSYSYADRYDVQVEDQDDLLCLVVCEEAMHCFQWASGRSREYYEEIMRVGYEMNQQEIEARAFAIRHADGAKDALQKSRFRRTAE